MVLLTETDTAEQREKILATTSDELQEQHVSAEDDVKMETNLNDLSAIPLNEITTKTVMPEIVDSVGAEEEVVTASSDDAPSTPNLYDITLGLPSDEMGEIDEIGRTNGTPEMVRGPSKPSKDCVNFGCPKRSAEYFEAPLFIQSHYHANKKLKSLHVCAECYDAACERYEELCGALEDQQPLLLIEIPRPPELVEILDSSDEESDTKPVVRNHEKGDFDQDTLDLIENDLEDILSNTLKKVNIDQQMKWNLQILQHRFQSQEQETNDLQSDFRNLQKIADEMHTALYKSTNIFIEEQPSWDSMTGKEVQLASSTYPPHGVYIPPKIDQFSLYYAVRQKVLSAWVPCKIIEMPTENPEGDEKPTYKVKFLRTVKNVLTRSVPASNLAYGTAPSVRLNVGVRVIALFNTSAVLPRGTTKETTNLLRYNFYPGIIAEPLQRYNGWRYLIFFDDGYAQYVLHENVRVVCESSVHVWENVHPSSSEFIQNYLKQFSSRRPMVQVRKNQRMMTESNGKWQNARVSDVDGSLVQMAFEDGKRLEWIYRGSTRLGPLFREKQTLKNASTSTTKRNEPFIEYIVIDDDTSVVQHEPSIVKPPEPSPQSQRTFPAQAARDTPQQQEQKRAVARKSTTVPQRPAVQHLNNSTIYVDEDNRPKGKVVYYTAKKHLPPRKFVPHDCGTSCLYEVTYNLSSYSPLSKPLLSGWERQICKSKAKKVVAYRAPCGRRLRNMSELHQYLRMTNCSLNVENFDFDYAIHCLAEYVIDTCIVQKNVSIAWCTVMQTTN